MTEEKVWRNEFRDRVNDTTKECYNFLIQEQNAAKVRYAECAGCGKLVVSGPVTLPRFRKKPNEQYDKWLCGCCTTHE